MMKAFVVLMVTSFASLSFAANCQVTRGIKTEGVQAQEGSNGLAYVIDVGPGVAEVKIHPESNSVSMVLFSKKGSPTAQQTEIEGRESLYVNFEGESIFCSVN